MSKVQEVIRKVLGDNDHLISDINSKRLTPVIESALKKENLLFLGVGDESFREESNALMVQAVEDAKKIIKNSIVGVDCSAIAIIAQGLFFARLLFDNE